MERLDLIYNTDNSRKFEDLEYDYYMRNYLCGSVGKIYDFRNNRLPDVGCNKWNCAYCRPFKKFNLYMEILRYVYVYNLDKHFVITFEGKKLRDKISWFDSYKFMSKEWDKLVHTIKYNYYERYCKNGEYAPYIGENFSFIVLPRSQKSGYCHYHVLVPDEISWYYLDNIRKRYNLGYMSIKRNKSVAEYLSNDFFKDNEWVIPYQVYHYRCSRNIKINKYSEKNLFFTFDCDFETIEKKVFDTYGYPLPFEEYLKVFYKNLKK